MRHNILELRNINWNHTNIIKIQQQGRTDQAEGNLGGVRTSTSTSTRTSTSACVGGTHEARALGARAKHVLGFNEHPLLNFIIFC